MKKSSKVKVSSGDIQISNLECPVPGSMMRNDGEEEEERAWQMLGCTCSTFLTKIVIYRSNLLSVKAGPTVPYLCQDHLQQ